MLRALRPKAGSVFVILIANLFSFSALADGDKGQYNLFHPTPKVQMREMSTDRPDKTESPFTVDAGHFQIETDLITWTQDHSSDAGVVTKTKSAAIFVSNLKVGLTNAMDLQVVVTPHQSESTAVDGSSTVEKRGFGDTIVRLKYNFMGNDGGDIAFGVMPFMKVPTHSDNMGNKRVEGGLIVPLAVAMPHKWDLGLMAQINRNKNESDESFHTEFISTATVGHEIFGELGGYVEFYSQSSSEAGSAWVATADFGLTYGMTPNLQLDMGANVGLTRAADDLNPFVGISARF